MSAWAKLIERYASWKSNLYSRISGLKVKLQKKLRLKLKSLKNFLSYHYKRTDRTLFWLAVVLLICMFWSLYLIFF